MEHHDHQATEVGNVRLSEEATTGQQPRQARRIWRRLGMVPLVLALLLVGTLLYNGPFAAHPPLVKAAGSTCALSVGSETTVVTNAGLSTRWPDTKVGVVPLGNNVFDFFGSEANGTVGGVSGSLDSPNSQGIITNQAIQNQKLFRGNNYTPYNYAGGGRVYVASSTLWIMLYHAETDPPNSGTIYVSLGLAKSTDQGKNWTDLGAIISPHTPYDGSASAKRVDMGDGTFAIINGYMVVYSSEVPDGGTPFWLTAARAPLSAVTSNAANGTVPTFNKYYNGNWTEPGLGGNVSELIGSNAPRVYWDVSFNTDIGKYIAIGYGGNGTAASFNLLESTDGLTWGNQQTVASNNDNQEVYPAIVGSDGNQQQVSGSFYLYYSNLSNGGTLVRRTLSCASSGSSWQASTGFSATQRQNQWRYQYSLNGEQTFQDLSWDGTHSAWVDPSGYTDYCDIWANAQHPSSGACDAARVWVAPSAGTVTLGANGPVTVTAACSSNPGVQIRILKNGQQIWPASGWQQLSHGSSFTFPAGVTTTVAANDNLQFVIAHLGGDNACDGTTWDQTVLLGGSGGSTYQASTGFSATQRQNQWRYQYSLNGEQSFQDLSWDGTHSAWVDPNGYTDYCNIWQNSQHPSSGACDAARVWVAPSAGTVTLGANGPVTVTAACSSNPGVQIRILKNGQQIWPASGWQQLSHGSSLTFPAGVTTTIAANDNLQFVIAHLGSDNACDGTTWDQTITMQ